MLQGGVEVATLGVEAKVAMASKEVAEKEEGALVGLMAGQKVEDTTAVGR